MANIREESDRTAGVTHDGPTPDLGIGVPPTSGVPLGLGASPGSPISPMMTRDGRPQRGKQSLALWALILISVAAIAAVVFLMQRSRANDVPGHTPSDDMSTPRAPVGDKRQ
jgi:hypothetical protein